MPAYAKPIITYRCDWPSCRTNATTEVLNTRNAPCGHFCQKHAARKITELNTRNSHPSNSEEHQS